MAKDRHIHIGTSGWHYGHWEGPFYPDHIKSDRYLEYYSKFFHTVEINSSFYRMPDKETVREWRDTVPEKFIFSVKASRYITHMKKLKEPLEAVSFLVNTVSLFENKLGPILFQLPPRWHVDAERLESFVRSLPRNRSYAFEFRDTSWFDKRVYEILERHNMAFCIYEIGRVLSPRIVTADIVYVRLHGPDGPYRGKYSDHVLEGWAGAFSGWAKQGMEVFCYFDNDEAGYAPQDAMRLQEMVA
ncbi:MAG: DUF72 domain-containing protein [Thermodesulfobacteriota bacterium]